MGNFQYNSIADNLEALINEGTYPIGEKLPSLRSVHHQYNVSIGTVLKAFILLEDKGLIAGKERSGYVVLRKSVSHSDLPQHARYKASVQTVRVDQTLQQVNAPSAIGKNYISFFNAVPDIALLPFNAIRRSLQQASRDLTGAHLLYEQPAGNALLRQEIAKRSFHWNGKLAAEEVVITNGAMEAVNLCLRAVTKMGDTVVVETPFYHGILQSIQALGLKIIELPGNSATGIDLPKLEEICQKQQVAACVLLSNFNNPNGVMLTDEKKKAIAHFANRRKVPVIDDDIYGDLHFDPRRPTNLKSYDTNGWVLLCSSFSKSVAPGYRIGWCAPGRFIEQVVKLKMVTNVATTSIVQLSLLSLLKTGAYDRHLRKLRPELHRLMLLTTQVIEKYFPEGTRISRPRGGIVLWVQLPAGTDAFALQKAALAMQINIAPGPLFSNKGDYTNYIRISCNHAWSSRVEGALKKLGGIIKKAV